MQSITLAAEPRSDGLQVRIGWDEPVPGGALILSVTGADGRLLTQQRLPLLGQTTALDHRLELEGVPLRVKAVLVRRDEVLAHARLDLHISLTVFES